MAGKKYELVLSDIKQWCGRTLYRIRALKDFGCFKAGELGGYIEKEDNLSQDGDAWVFGNAWVYGNAQVFGNARVYGNVKVDFVLCSRFNFEFQAQLSKWLELEKQFEEIKDTLKDEPKNLEDLTK